jgi:hypothetical protein
MELRWGTNGGNGTRIKNKWNADDADRTDQNKD